MPGEDARVLPWACRAIVLLIPGCFHPFYDHPACGPHGECPSGFTCNMASDFCESGSSMNTPDATTGDPDGGGVCGDGVKTGSEPCDDGNQVPFDGCSPTCTIEPVCTGGVCTARCGDGIVLAPEECDDGNRVSGDGCNDNCKLEPSSGFDCKLNNQPPPPGTLVIPILYRDMRYDNSTNGHPDFENLNSGLAHGLVQGMLGADSKPVWNDNFGDRTQGQSLTGPDNFCSWYHDSCAGSPDPLARRVFLDSAGKPTTLTLIQQGTSNVYQFDNQLFFPVDGLGWNAPQSSLPAQVDDGLDGLVHNFSFTSELHYPFTYVAGAKPLLEFTGDDDVWVFINGHLAVDLGGVHGATSGSVALDTLHATQFGLTDGGMYSIDIFQAERHTFSSTYKLTLSGFVHAMTTCAPICGDSKVVGNEVCDDGPLNGMPGHCNATCSGRG